MSAWQLLNEGTDAECEFAEGRAAGQEFTAYAFTSGAWSLFAADDTDAALASGTAADREAAKRACVEAVAIVAERAQ